MGFDWQWLGYRLDEGAIKVPSREFITRRESVVHLPGKGPCQGARCKSPGGFRLLRVGGAIRRGSAAARQDLRPKVTGKSIWISIRRISHNLSAAPRPSTPTTYIACARAFRARGEEGLGVDAREPGTFYVVKRSRGPKITRMIDDRVISGEAIPPAPPPLALPSLSSSCRRARQTHPIASGSGFPPRRGNDLRTSLLLPSRPSLPSYDRRFPNKSYTSLSSFLNNPTRNSTHLISSCRSPAFPFPFSIGFQAFQPSSAVCGHTLAALLA
jgi:hypothetical protein